MTKFTRLWLMDIFSKIWLKLIEKSSTIAFRRKISRQHPVRSINSEREPRSKNNVISWIMIYKLYMIKICTYSLVQLSTAFILQSAVFSCHFVAYAKSQFVTHLSNVIREVHENSKSSRCDICEKVLKRRDNYDRHIRVCKEEFKCCGLTLKCLFHRTARLH